MSTELAVIIFWDHIGQARWFLNSWGGGGGGGGGEGRAAAIYDISRYFIFIAIRDISRYFLSYRDTNVHGNRRSSTGIDRNIQEVIY